MKNASAVVCLLIFSTFARADNWPQWRGPQNNGHSKEKGLPTTWDPKTNIAWTLPLPGRGGSTPAIWGERIFLTSMDGNDVVLLCANTDGKLLWQKTVAGSTGSTSKKPDPKKGGSKKGGLADEGDKASPSPSTDGKHVFIYTGTADFACYDFDGNEVWKFNVKKRYGDFSIQHGIHITPLLHEDRLYFALLGNGNKHYVIALDKATGTDVWKIERTNTTAKAESREAYTSPVLWKNNGELNLVILGCDFCTGHRLKDGAELWRLGDLNLRAVGNHRIITSPVASDDLLVVPTCRGQLVVGLKPGVSGFIKTGSPQEQWRTTDWAPDVSCPLIHDGVVYLPQSNRTLVCVDAKTGTKLYEQPLTSNRYRASPVYADGKVYLTGRDDSTVVVVKAGRKFEELARNVLPGESFTASPAIANGRIYLRGFNALYAISERGK